MKPLWGFTGVRREDREDSLGVDHSDAPYYRLTGMTEKLQHAFGINANYELIVERTDHGPLLGPAISVPLEIYIEERISEFAREERALGRKLRSAG
jgi:hypothetical protein